MKKGYFNSNEYNTPEKKTYSLKDRIFLRNRLYFILKYAYVVLRTRKEAIRKQFDTKASTDSSLEILRFVEMIGC